MRPPPRSTPFPYTTLFRSCCNDHFCFFLKRKMECVSADITRFPSHLTAALCCKPEIFVHASLKIFLTGQMKIKFIFQVQGFIMKQLSVCSYLNIDMVTRSEERRVGNECR